MTCVSGLLGSFIAIVFPNLPRSCNVWPSSQAAVHFANPNGNPGTKTRTWLSVDGEPIAASAGFCCKTPEFGPVYVGMTMTANDCVMPYNDRMPVLLAPHGYDRWLHGTIKVVIAFQFRPPLAAARTVVEHTDDRWRSGSPPPSGRAQLALL